MQIPFETFPFLDTPECAHAFIQRIPGLDVRVDREEALARLEAYHAQVRLQLGFTEYAVGEQVHGKAIAIARTDTDNHGQEIAPQVSVHVHDRPWESVPTPGVDGLITNRPGLCLGVRVADCCPVYLFDPVQKVIGLLHSGRKGTELGIAPAALALMQEHFGTKPADVRVQLGPCIRPPLYEVDIAAEIIRQVRAAGVIHWNDCGANTGADLERYYSYRVEKGRTGRLLALFGLKSRV